MKRRKRRPGAVLAVLVVVSMLVPAVVTEAPTLAAEADPDLALFDPARGMWHLRYADGTIQDFFYGVPGDTALMGDFDCDGIDTVAMYRETSGFIYLRNSNEFGVGEQEFFYGIPGDIPITGDWDGDGCDTFGIYRHGRVFLSNHLGTRPADVSFYFGVPGDRPFAGDFDGDGIDTIGLYRETSGFVYFTDTIPGQDGVAPTDNSFFYGVPSDRVVAGDWDGDGDDSIGIYRASDRAFYLSFENRQGFADRKILFGESTWMPAAGSFGPSPLTSPPPNLDNVQWETMGGPPGAGRVQQLIHSMSPTHVLYALTDHGLYTSADRGNHWALIPGFENEWVRSIAARNNELIACGENGFYQLADGTVIATQAIPCQAVGVDATTIAIGNGSPSLSGVAVYRRSGSEAWQDISPQPSDLTGLSLPPAEMAFGIQVPFVVPVGDDVLAVFRVSVAGSGEFTNDGLYRWKSNGATWSPVQVPAPGDVIVSKLTVDPQDPPRVLVAFRHPILHEFSHPISQLAFESSDGGTSWLPITQAPIESNGVTDVVETGAERYLLSPYDGYMLRIDGNEWETIPAPALADYPQFAFGLETLLIDPADPDTAYAMPGSAWELGLLKSTDGMQTWHKMDGTIVGSSPTIVVSHPNDPQVVLTSGNVIQESYATRDGGTTWDPFSPVAAGDELRIDPHNEGHMLLVDERTTFFESFDGGETFTQIADEFTGAKVLDFEIAADDPDLIYASNLGVGISRFVSGDWQHMSNSPDYAYDIEIDPDDSAIIYATNSPKKFENHSSIWRYNPGQTAAFGWSEILTVEDSAGITSLRFDPSDSDTMYAGLTGEEGTVLVSRDRGATWAELNPALTFTTVQGHSQLAVNPEDEDAVYVGTWGGGSFRSTDAGQTWSMLDDEHTFSPTCLVAWDADPQILYACDRTAAKIHKSLDGGETWHEYYDFGRGHLTTTAIAIDPNDHDLIYAAAFRPPVAMLGSLFKIDAGEKIGDLGGQLPRAAIDIAIDPRAPSTLYVTTHLHGLFRSDDAGVSWDRLDDRGTGLPRTGFLDVDVHPDDSHVLYASSLCGQIPDYVLEPVLDVLNTTEPFLNIDPTAKCGVYKSTNRGQSWSLVLETLGEAKGIDIPQAHPDHIYVADSAGGIWVSTDRGVGWHQENQGLGTTSATAVAVGDELVYAGTQGSGISVGTIAADGSISWRGDRSPRVEVYRIQIEVDPLNPDRLYASAYPGGVLRSDDGGITWSAKNFLTPSIRVTDPVLQGYYALDIDPTDPDTVWLGVYGKGLIVSHDGRDFGIFANGEDQILRGKHITSVAVDPQISDRVFVGAEEGIFVSTDGGATWAPVNSGLGTTDVRSLKLAMVDLAPFVADFTGDGDGGFELEAGWSVSNGGLAGTGHSWARAGSSAWSDYSFQTEVELLGGILHINARVSNEGRYFIGIGENVMYLSRQYDQWEQFADLAQAPANVVLGQRYLVRIELEGAHIRVYLDGTLLIDHTDPQPLSTGSIAFESLEGSSVIVDNVRVDPSPGLPQPYAGTGGYGLYRLDQPKQQWSSLGRTLGGGWWAPWERRMYQFSSILFDPSVTDRVYFGHFPGGFFISEDGGHTWKDSSVGLGNDGMFSLAQHPQDPDILFAGTYNGVVKSTDGGATWAASSTGMPPEQWPYTVAIDDEKPNVMYASTKNGQNKGFCQRNQFCGVVMKSTDGGQTWHQTMSGLNEESEFYTLLIYPPDHDTLFLSTSRGIYVSLDAGKNWWPMNSGLPSTDNQVRDNVADNLALSGDNRYLFLGLVKHGVWRADLQQLTD